MYIYNIDIMKIAIIQPRTSYFVGGAEAVSIEHAKMAVKFGYEVDFYTSNPNSFREKYSTKYKEFYEKYRQKVNFIELNQSEKFSKFAKIQPGENKSRWFIESVFFAQSLSHRMEKFAKNYDITISYFAFDGMLISRNQADKNVLYLLGNPSNESDFRETQLAMYDKIIAISPQVRDFWQKYTDKNIPVVATGVDFAKFHSEKDESLRKLNVVFVGRLILRKGVLVLLEAVKNFAEKNEISLKIIGKGPQKVELEKFVYKNNLAKIVKFVGEVSDIENYFARADVAIFPSLYGDGLMGSVLEAMASSCVVISTKNNGNDEILADVRGFLIEPNNEKEVREKLEFTLKNRGAVREIGEKSRRYIEKNFSWNESFAKFMAEIEK